MSIRSVFVDARENGVKTVAPVVLLIPIAAILPHVRRRRLNPAYIARLAESIRDLELYHPITVAPLTDGVYPLIAGEHRLEACKCLGWSEIPAVIADVDEITCQLWQIDENLERAELTELERAQHLTDRKALYLAKHPETAHGGDRASRQIGDLKQVSSFVADTSVMTGLSQRSVERAIHRAKVITPEAQEAAAEIPEIADSGVELDALARLPEEEQMEAVQAVKSGKARSVREAITREQKRACPTKSEAWRITICSVWERASPEDRQWFLEWVQSL